MIRKVHGIKGVQFIQKDGATAQSTVEHIHFHCLPFDAPDLSAWNYRQLAHTPLENAKKYQYHGKKFAELAAKFDQKYSEHTE